MLYHWLYPLRDLFFGFNIFRYISWRAALASVTAFLLSVALGGRLIALLRARGIGQEVRSRQEVPGLYPLHERKRGTPTMGGLLMLFAVVVSIALWGNLSNKYVWLALFVTVWLGIVGFVDDYIKLVQRNARGLASRVKLLGQTSVGLLVGVALYNDPSVDTRLVVPFLKDWSWPLGWWFVPFVALVIVATSNAVNLTDGLDGLATGCLVMVAGAYVGLSYIAGHAGLADYLNVPHVPGAGELAVVCAALVGACVGFLWFNSYPASVFMGDVGALALGGAIGTIAVCVKKEILLLLIGGVFVAEAASVLLQVGSYRLRGQRIFRMAPVHHHFQLAGWQEPKVTVRFWIVGFILAVTGLATLKLQ